MFFKAMKLHSINDIRKLPSVLDVEEVSELLIDLVTVIRKDKISPIKGAEAINDLISYLGYSKEEISLKATNVVLKWTSEAYDGENNELVEWHAANVVNMSRKEAIAFFQNRLALDITSFERNEINECLSEIGVET